MKILTLIALMAIVGMSLGQSFQEMVGQVYKQKEPVPVILCAEDKKVQTLEELHTIATEAWKELYSSSSDGASVTPKEIGAMLKKKGWRNPICYPVYGGQYYWSQKTGGTSPHALWTGPGSSCATKAWDEKNQTVDLVNLVWRERNGMKTYINLYEYPGNGTTRVICWMNVTKIDWDCSVATA